MKIVIVSIILLITAGKAISEDGIFKIVAQDEPLLRIKDGYLLEKHKIKRLEGIKIKKISLYESLGSRRGNHTIQIDLEGTLETNIVIFLVLGKNVLLQEISVGRRSKATWISIGSDDLDLIRRWLNQLKLLKKSEA